MTAIHIPIVPLLIVVSLLLAGNALLHGDPERNALRQAPLVVDVAVDFVTARQSSAAIVGAVTQSTFSRWRIDSVPVLSIGTADGASPSLLFTRVVSVTRLENGSLVVADDDPKEIRIFDAQGRHVRSFGRAGSGPGEFRSIQKVQRVRGDSIVAGDASGRVHVFAPNGALARTIVPWRVVRLLGVFDDGSMAVQPSSVEMIEQPTGVRTATVKVHRMGIGGDSVASIGIFPEMLQSPPVYPVMFGPRGYGAVREQRYYRAFGDKFAVEVFDASGRKIQVLTRPWAPIRVSSEDKARYRQVFLGGATDESRQRLTTMYANLVSAEFHPAISQLLVDPRANVWVRNTRIEDGLPLLDPLQVGPAPTWTVFSPSGAMLGEITTPRGVQIHEIGLDYVVGVFRDKDDVASIRLYRLQRT